jgi:hypothetical protein
VGKREWRIRAEETGEVEQGRTQHGDVGRRLDFITRSISWARRVDQGGLDNKPIINYSSDKQHHYIYIIIHAYTFRVRTRAHPRTPSNLEQSRQEIVLAATLPLRRRMYVTGGLSHQIHQGVAILLVCAFFCPARFDSRCYRDLRGIRAVMTAHGTIARPR